MLILLLIAGAVFLLAAGGYAYKIAFFSPAKDKEKGPPILEGTPYDPYREEIGRLYRAVRDREGEFVTVTSHDGLTLSGRYYHVADGAPVDIGFHGYRSNAFIDFLGANALSIHWGHNLLLVDQRAHGKSQGRTITFGIKERLDVLTWLDYVNGRFGPETPILLYGVSMGAATVLMASGLDLPGNVKGIVADCPYSSPLDVIAHVGKSNPLPQWLVRIAAIAGAAIYGGFDLREADAEAAVKEAKVPILIFHGEADDFVLPSMSEGPARVNPEWVERHTFPGAGHALCYMTDTERYWQTVTEFVQRVTKA